jgi:hypothetical protein
MRLHAGEKGNGMPKKKSVEPEKTEGATREEAFDGLAGLLGRAAEEEAVEQRDHPARWLAGESSSLAARLVRAAEVIDGMRDRAEIAGTIATIRPALTRMSRAVRAIEKTKKAS